MPSIHFNDILNRARALDLCAQNEVGVFYRYGWEGVVRDYGIAYFWFKEAANQGYAPAQFNLGVCYANGQGVAQNYETAVLWFRRAAEQGHTHTQFEEEFFSRNRRGERNGVAAQEDLERTAISIEPNNKDDESDHDSTYKGSSPKFSV